MTKISVTSEDILRCQTDPNCPDCPIDLAARRVWPNARFSTAPTCILFYSRGPDAAATILLPDAAREFVQAFDAGKPVHPFEFEIDVSSISDELLTARGDIIRA